MYLGSLDGGLPICLDKFTANEEKNHVQNKNDYYLPKYSHLSNSRGGWNKRRGWDFLERKN